MCEYIVLCLLCKEVVAFFAVLVGFVGSRGNGRWLGDKSCLFVE
jgi:hypothetical protein